MHGRTVAVAQYLGQTKAMGQSSRAMLSEIRRQFAVEDLGVIPHSVEIIADGYVEPELGPPRNIT